jgi:ABC-type nitrate/sulfonate/bicarbonate transport system permease component
MRHAAAPAAVLLLALAVWQVATVGLHTSPLLLPSPEATLRAFVTYGAALLDGGAYTAAEALAGLAIGNALGLALAILFVHSPLSRRTIYPLALAAQTLPIVAVAPALVIWFGSGMAPKICVTAFLVFFPMLVNAMRGLRSADAAAADLLHALSASAWQRLWLLRLPASLPYVFAALRLSACACFVAAIVAEWVSADRGLGYLIVFAGTQYHTDEIWAAVIVGTALSMACVGVVMLVERAAAPWLIPQ